jgi:hypothetical protein
MEDRKAKKEKIRKEEFDRSQFSKHPGNPLNILSRFIGRQGGLS